MNIVEQLERMARSLRSRLGAGQDWTTAFDRDKWHAELAADVGPGPAMSIVAIVDERGRDAEDPAAIFDELIAEARAGITVPVPTGDHVLYTLGNHAGDAIYIGITSRGMIRTVEHERLKPWWHEVASIELTRFRTRGAAEAAERRAIRRLRPRYNIQHNSPT